MAVSLCWPPLHAVHGGEAISLQERRHGALPLLLLGGLPICGLLGRSLPRILGGLCLALQVKETRSLAFSAISATSLASSGSALASASSDSFTSQARSKRPKLCASCMSSCT